jgi:sulfite exporter TauE/SafE
VELWTGFTLGLLGSLHCVGMCGPIAMALPLTATERSQIVFQSLLYNFGRIITYALLGFFMGLMGWGLMIAGYQKAFSMILGGFLIASAIFSFSVEHHLLKNKFIQNAFNSIKAKLSKMLSIKSNSSAIKIGLLNGILPCGLVYIALAGAVSSSTVLSGSIYMIAFGLGTLPMMLGVMSFGKMYKISFLKIRKWIPVGLFLFGVFFIYRGMMLDIPLNLKFWEANNFPILCH